VRRGKPRPAYVVEAIRKAHLGWSPSDEVRQKIRDAAKRNGAYPPAAGKPFIPEEDAILGTATDREIAAKLGRDMNTIHARRKRLGIPAFVKRKPQGKPVVWTPAKDKLLGKAPDPVVARRLGCKPEAVFYRRKRLKIPAFRQKCSPALPSVVTPYNDGIRNAEPHRCVGRCVGPEQVWLFVWSGFALLVSITPEVCGRLLRGRR
jgi:hypothetical protein